MTIARETHRKIFMRDSQTLFSVFFAVFYGSMLSSSQGLQLFPWGFFSEKIKSNKIILTNRLFITIPIFNILPIFMFSLAYQILGASGSFCDKQLTFSKIFLISLSSFSIFGPYRLFHALMIYLGKRHFSYSNFNLYNQFEYEEIITKRNIRRSVKGHLIATCCYFLPYILLLIIAF
jgi:hypothetical protein